MVLRALRYSFRKFPSHWLLLVKFGLMTVFTIGVYLSLLRPKWTSNDTGSYLPNLRNVIDIESSPLLNHTNTRMTFDPRLVVQCKKSPYVICEEEPVVELNRTFKISAPNYKLWFKEEAFSMKSCKYKNCVFRGDTFSKRSDIIAVYSILIDSNRPMPPRSPHQTYIFLGWESPYLFFGFLENKESEWNRIFNLTMTYRLDADIFVPYSKIRFDPIPLGSRPNYLEIARNKTKTVAWLISHCLASSKREEYIKEMRKYVDVDILGQCGEKCPEDKYYCVKYIALTYKFYIAFENSLCTDYTTEKFFKVFNPDTPIIPVVRGKTDYGKYFPENTFIDAANFKSAKDLALHLKRLGSDLETYSKYLEYKDLYSVTDDYLNVAGCSLCEQLNTKKLEPKRYDTYDWFVNGHCDTDPEKDIWDN